MSSRFPLLEGVPSIQALVEDPQYAQVRAEFESYPGHQVPEVNARADAAPGPHGAVPVRVYDLNLPASLGPVSDALELIAETRRAGPGRHSFEAPAAS